MVKGTAFPRVPTVINLRRECIPEDGGKQSKCGGTEAPYLSVLSAHLGQFDVEQCRRRLKCSICRAEKEKCLYWRFFFSAFDRFTSDENVSYHDTKGNE